MVITFSESNITMLISFTADETEVVSWMRAHYGDHEFNMYLTKMLKDRAAQMNDTLKEKLWKSLQTDQELNDVVSLITEANLARMMVKKEENNNG